MAILIILVLVIFVWFISTYKEPKQRVIIDNPEQMSMQMIRNQFKTVISKFESRYLPRVIQKSQLDANPNKQQAINDMAEKGELNDIIKEEIRFLHNDIDDLIVEIFDLAFFRATIKGILDSETKNNFVKYLGENSSLFYDLRNEITEEFRITKVLKYSDSQIDNFICRLINKTERELYIQTNKLIDDKFSNLKRTL